MTGFVTYPPVENIHHLSREIYGFLGFADAVAFRNTNNRETLGRFFRLCYILIEANSRIRGSIGLKTRTFD